MKYAALVIGKEFVTIDNTTCQPITTTAEQRLMDAIFGDKYSHVYLYTKLQRITANTIDELQERFWHVASTARWSTIGDGTNTEVEMVFVKHPRIKD